ncbi:nuclear transport factor 2 family protein [Mucilaginibacter litoreus]|uniref:Nuclear transport factor 2 family protein n=1 Tax=Mucilaginibacter litoreus TaxID=1048221 RepID=A0ABW3AWZ5_9SPHI
MNKQELKTLATELENQRCAAMETGDLDELKKYFSKDLFYGHAGGFADNFDSFLERLNSGSAKYNQVTVKVDDVIELGETAFTLNGKVYVEAEINSLPVILHCVYAGVWKQEDSQWRFVMHQSARLPQ